MRGQATYRGTAGVCVGGPPGICDNAADDHTCGGEPPDDSDCDWSSLTGTAAGTTNLTPVKPEEEFIVPTMTEWGLIIFTILAGIGSLYYIRKRKQI
jgi:hypothetical protein